MVAACYSTPCIVKETSGISCPNPLYLSKVTLVILVFLFALGFMPVTQVVRNHEAITASDEGILVLVFIVLLLFFNEFHGCLCLQEATCLIEASCLWEVQPLTEA